MPTEIMFVEDDHLLGKALVRHFEQSGFKCVWAQNGEMTFSLLPEHQVSLIFLDLVLPGMSGFDILQRLKAEPTYKAIPVVILSNLSSMDEINNCMELGAVDYVIKSNISLEELIDIANKNMRK